MKKIAFLLTILASCIVSFAQKKAVTETGEEVILYEDGTWKPSVDAINDNKEIPVSSAIFKKGVNASFLLKSTRINMGVWLDSKKWGFKKATNNEEAEYEFQLKGKDLYGMMISEKIEVPIETLKMVALENAKKAAPDVRIIKEEYRTVNNKKVLMLQMNGSTQGIKFTYCGYYFSNASGTVQFVTYTAQNLFSSFRDEAEEFLNGLVQVE